MAPPGQLPTIAGPPKAIGKLGSTFAMTFAMAAFACRDTLMKLASGTLPTGVRVSFRGVFIISTVLAAIIVSGNVADLSRALHFAVAIRAVVTVGGIVFFLVAGSTMPTREHVSAVLAASVFSIIEQSAIIVAMRAGVISVIAPHRYSLLPFASALGYLVWGDLPDRIAVIGMAIVVAAGRRTSYREEMRRRKTALGNARRD